MNYLGDYPTGATVYVWFHTFASTGASVTLTGLAAADIDIYKNGTTTERSSTNGFTLLDTDGIDFDGATGIHGFSIDLSDNTDAGFYAAGSEYAVMVNAVTVDGVTVRFVAATFSIERAGGVLALAKGANGFSAIKTETAAILVDTGTTLDAALAVVDGNVDDIETAVNALVADIGANGAGLTAIPWNAAWDAEVESEVNDALVAIHLDHLLAAEYDPASKPGNAAALLNELVESDAGVARFTANALEEAPTGSGSSGITVLLSGTAQAGGADTIQLAAASTSADNQLELCTINLTAGTGAPQTRQLITGTTADEVYTVNEPWAIVPDNTTEYEIIGNGISAAELDDVAGSVWGALRAEHNEVDSFGEYVFSDVVKISDDAGAADNAELFFDGTGLTLTNVVLPWNAAWDAEVQSEVTDALNAYDPPTNAEMEARTIAAASYATAAALQTVDDLIDTEIAAIIASLATIDGNVASTESDVVAIKAKTDNLTFSEAGHVDANTKLINDHPVSGGDGSAWGRD